MKSTLPASIVFEVWFFPEDGGTPQCVGQTYGGRDEALHFAETFAHRHIVNGHLRKGTHEAVMVDRRIIRQEEVA